MATKTDVVQVLTRARDLIRRGWTQGQNQRDFMGRKCYCLTGAVFAANPSSAPHTTYVRARAIRVLHSTLRNILGHDRAVWAWNDQKERTQAEVLDLLDKTIAEL